MKIKKYNKYDFEETRREWSCHGFLGYCRVVKKKKKVK